MVSELRVAVIGLGAMGTSHLRVWNEIQPARVVAVSDPRSDVVESAIRDHLATGYTDYTEMFAKEQLDAVSIAVPTSLHTEVAMSAINRGLAILIEKPLADSTLQARTIIEAAEARGILAMVGHIERFNPAVQELQRRVVAGDLGPLFSVRAERTGPTSFRVQDAGVILDMATHDLDILGWIVASPVRTIYAAVSRRRSSTAEDLLLGLLSFHDGTLGLLDVNWLSPTKTRQLSVLGEKGMFLVDYLRQDLYFYDNSLASDLEFDALANFVGVSEGDMVKIHIDRAEPLRLELEAFMNAFLRGLPAPVTLEDGLKAVWLAERAEESAAAGRPIGLGRDQ